MRVFFNKEVVESFLFSFKIVRSSTKRYTYLSVFPALIGSLVPLGTVYMIKLVIDETSLAINASDATAHFNKIIILVLITALFFLVNYITDALEEYIKSIRQYYFFDYITKLIYEKTSNIELEYFENDKYYDLFSRALDNAQIRPLNIVNNTIHLTQNIIALLSLIILLLSLHYSIFLVLIIATVPLAIVKIRFANILYKRYKKDTPKHRKIIDIDNVLTRERFAAELRLYGLKEFFVTMFKSIRDRIRNKYFKIYNKRFFFEIGAQLISVIAIFSAFLIVCHQTILGILSIGALTMYLMAIQKGLSLFNAVFGNLTGLYDNSLYVNNLKSFLQLPEIQEKIDKKSFPNQMKEGIELKNISFKYKGSQRNALHNINMRIKAGSTVAIVGPNGAGKTTLVKLICNLYKASKGEILFDGKEIKEFSNQSIRDNIAALFQNYAIFNFTAKENIFFGDINKKNREENVIIAAKKAGIHDFIESLPQGYDTVLGKIYDESEELSIGQWQKIGLARVFYKDSQIVILDEPTASLDPQSEYEIFKMFKSLTQNKTAIIISHRYSTVKMADYIFVMDKERIVEQGAHEELLKEKGLYAKMYNLQASNYK